MNDFEKESIERDKKRNTVLAAIIGFGAGAIVGSITALLYAPQSGTETRDKIREKFNDVSEKAGETLDKTKDSLADVRERMSAAYDSAVEKTSSAIEKAKEKFSGKKDEEAE